MKNRDNSHVHFLGLWQELNDLAHVNCSQQCRAHSECPIHVISCHHHSNIGTREQEAQSLRESRVRMNRRGVQEEHGGRARKHGDFRVLNTLLVSCPKKRLFIVELKVI